MTGDPLPRLPRNAVPSSFSIAVEQFFPKVAQLMQGDGV